MVREQSPGPGHQYLLSWQNAMERTAIVLLMVFVQKGQPENCKLTWLDVGLIVQIIEFCFPPLPIQNLPCLWLTDPLYMANDWEPCSALTNRSVWPLQRVVSNVEKLVGGFIDMLNHGIIKYEMWSLRILRDPHENLAFCDSNYMYRPLWYAGGDFSAVQPLTVLSMLREIASVMHQFCPVIPDSFEYPCKHPWFLEHVSQGYLATLSRRNQTYPYAKHTKLVLAVYFSMQHRFCVRGIGEYFLRDFNTDPDKCIAQINDFDNFPTWPK